MQVKIITISLERGPAQWWHLKLLRGFELAIAFFVPFSSNFILFSFLFFSWTYLVFSRPIPKPLHKIPWNWKVWDSKGFYGGRVLVGCEQESRGMRMYPIDICHVLFWPGIAKWEKWPKANRNSWVVCLGFLL